MIINIYYNIGTYIHMNKHLLHQKNVKYKTLNLIKSNSIYL